MILLFFTLLILGLLHFVCESIVVPPYRMYLENQLCLLRMELLGIARNGIAKQDQQAFRIVLRGLEQLQDHLQNLTISRQWQINREYHRNDKFRMAVEKKIAIVESCRNSDINRIFCDASQVVKHAFLLNLAGLFIYVIPGLIAWSMIASLSKLATELVALPRQDADRLLTPT